jgi:DNA polymerase I
VLRVVVDFEFKVGDPARNPPRVVCMAWMEIYSDGTWGQAHAMWEEELYALAECPFPTGPDTLVICYQAKAEGACFAALKWKPVARAVDLFIERRRLTNPAKWPSLLETLAAYGLPGTSSAAHKTAMRNAVIHNDWWSPELREAIKQYTKGDVTDPARLMAAMDSHGDISWETAEWRGTANFYYGYIENLGIPLDVDAYRNFRAHREAIILSMIAEVEAEHGYDVHRGTTLHRKKLAALADRLGIPDWPTTPLMGQLSISGATLGRMVKRCRYLEALAELRDEIDKLRDVKLAIGDDGKNRFDYATFGSKTARCQPSTTESVMCVAKWMRGFVWNPPDSGVVYAVIDYVGEEFGIGAARSNDKAMQAAYRTHDIHIGTAIAAAIAPPGATAESHPQARRLGKTLNFAIMYGAGARGLADKLKSSEREAAQLLADIRAAFPDFTAWADWQVAAAQCRGWIGTPLGWLLDAALEDNARTIRNLQMQAGGSEILYALVVLLIGTHAIQVCATMHDAIMVRLPLATWREDLDRVRRVMAEVSKAMLGDFELFTDERVIMPGERYLREGEEGWGQWQKVAAILERHVAGQDNRRLTPVVTSYQYKKEKNPPSGVWGVPGAPPAGND